MTSADDDDDDDNRIMVTGKEKKQHNPHFDWFSINPTASVQFSLPPGVKSTRKTKAVTKATFNLFHISIVGGMNEYAHILPCESETMATRTKEAREGMRWN